MENSVQLIYAGRKNLASYSSLGSDSSRSHNSDRGMSNETEARARALADRMSEVARILANEPSLALYRIEEHVRKTVPRLSAQRSDVVRLDRDIAGHVTDVDCVLSALHSISRSRSSFQSIGNLARNALFTKQNLDYERRSAIKRSSADVVHRLSSSGSPVTAAVDAPAANSSGSAGASTAAAQLGSSAAGNSGSMLESAKTFLRSKTIDYSQNLIRRAQAAKSVEIPAGVDFSQVPPLPPLHAPPTPPPPPPPPPPHMPPPASLMTPQRSSSAQLLLKPVNECEESAQSPPSQQQPAMQQPIEIEKSLSETASENREPEPAESTEKPGDQKDKHNTE